MIDYIAGRVFIFYFQSESIYAYLHLNAYKDYEKIYVKSSRIFDIYRSLFEFV
jgi:hypothetical protein